MNQPTHCKIPAHSLLTLDICDIESLAVVRMLSCVTGYPSLHLNTLFLTNLGTPKDEGVLDFLCHTPDIQIGHLSLCNITCSLQQCQNQWDSNFCDWNLSALEFCHCDIGQQGLLPLITQGLRKQLSSQTLHSFTTHLGSVQSQKYIYCLIQFFHSQTSMNFI